MATGLLRGRSVGYAARHAYPRRWAILAVLCSSLLVVVLDNSILNVAIPTLVRDLGASNQEIQWIVDAYTLVFAGLLLTMGSLGDRYGRRGALQAGFVTFGLGSPASPSPGPRGTSSRRGRSWALGLAMVGSVASSIYASRVGAFFDGQAAALPPAARAGLQAARGVATSQSGQALAVAQELPGRPGVAPGVATRFGGQLVDVANQAFVSGMRAGLPAAAGAAAGALITARRLPARPRAPHPPGPPAPGGAP